MRFLIAVGLLAFAVEVNAQNMICSGGVCRVVPVAVVPVQPIVVVPQVTYQPYQYQSSSYVVRRGPLGLFRWGRFYHTYTPVQPQAKQ